MIEAGANEVPNDVMFEAIKQAHEENQKQIAAGVAGDDQAEDPLVVHTGLAEQGREPVDTGGQIAVSYPHLDVYKRQSQSIG